jgi:hypothetical protein
MKGGPVKQLGCVLLSIGTYGVLFLLGAVLFTVPMASPEPPASPAVTFGALGVIACVDTWLVLSVVRTSRLHGLRLMLLLAPLFYFVKTLTSTIEALYFMPNVTRDLLPSLVLATVPLALGFTPLAVWVSGRAKAGSLDEAPGFKPWPMGRAERIAKTLLLAVLVYPTLFFGAGWYIAFRSPALREFYGGAHGQNFAQSMLWTFNHEPGTYCLEVMRGALWVGAALLILRTTRGPWWLGTLWVALWFGLLHTDVLLLPNPLMIAEIRAYHFVETASSNMVFALCIGWLFSRSHLKGSSSSWPSLLRRRAQSPKVSDVRLS